jgi:hypothetical protein
MRLILLLTTILMGLPGAAEADIFGTCPKSFTKQEIRLPLQCPGCEVGNPNCICSPGSVIGAVCVKGSQVNGLFVQRSPDSKKRKGRVTSRVRYKDGRPVGKHVTFHHNGRRASLFLYDKEGMISAWREWHANGKLSGHGAFKDGVRVGETEFFYPNGQRMSVRDESGLAIYYLDDGQEFSRIISGDDKPITFVVCQKGTERRDEAYTVSCVNPQGEPVGRYAQYGAGGGTRTPVEIGVYVDGKKTQVRRFKNFSYRHEYASMARPH